MLFGLREEAACRGPMRPADLSHRLGHSGTTTVETLECRALLCSTHIGTWDASASHASLNTVSVNETVEPEELSLAALPPTTNTPAAASAGKHPLSDLPDLSSLPGAPASIYLDFSGDYTAEWGGYHPGATPALNQDGDASTFTDAEISTIRETWQRVAEDFSPFNLNVTTDDPGNLDNGKTLRVVVGGTTSTAWYPTAVAGLGYVGAFSNDLPNTVFVFLNENPAYLADIISHEAGHGFGLNHQEVYGSDGSLTDEYSDGDAISRPIMGGGGGRAVWWRGTSGSAVNIQDDIAIIAGPINGFGLRPDDFSDSPATPAAMTLALDGQSQFASGVIGTSTDQDWFAFNSVGGNVSIAVDVAPDGADLDARLELRNVDGTLLNVADSSTLGEAMALNLPAGHYEIGVMSRHYGGSATTRVGDVGQYSLHVDPIVKQAFFGAPTLISSTLPTTLQAEDFDRGGQGVSYNDDTPGTNTGGVYRPAEGVDIKPTTDGNSAGFRLGDAHPGEWLDYTINVPTAGQFTLDTRVSNSDSGGAFHVELDSTNLTGSLAVPKTGSWSVYSTVSKSNIALPAGQHVLRLAFDAGTPTDNAAGGFNWIRLTPAAESVSPATRLSTTTAAYVRDGSNTSKNFGSDPQLMARLSSAGSTRQSYLKFDLSSVAVIRSASLQLNGKLSASSSAGVDVGVYGSDSTTWSEKSITWSTRPASAGSMISMTTVRGTSSKSYEWDVTEYLKAQKAAGHKVVTLVLRGLTATTSYAAFNSDDASSSRPELRIT